MNRYPKVGVDIDGVLANYVKAYSSRLITKTGSNLFEFKKDIPVWDDWNMDLKVGYSKEQRLITNKSIENDNFFWLQLEPYDGVHEALHRLSFITDNLYFITDRSGNSAKVQTEMWLSKMGVPNPTVIISAKKGDVAGAIGLDYYIDDNFDNCLDVLQRGAKTFLQTQPWNAEYVLPESIERVNNLMEFVNVIKSY